MRTMMVRGCALLCVLFWCSLALAEEYPAKVIGISDGDTITVLRDRTQVKVRLNGIDCPESGQDFGSRARELASELAFGKLVTVQVRDTDRYGRTVADIILPDGRVLNHELVREGLAWWYRKYAPNDGTLARLEAEAKAARRGLWAQANTVPPWEWRNQGLTGELGERFIGNRNSQVYHAPGCANAARMLEKNRVVFETAEDAVRAGYRPGKDCHR